MLIHRSLPHPFQISIRRDADQQLRLNPPVDLEFGMGFKIFPNCGFGVIALAPRTVREHFIWQVFNHRIEQAAGGGVC